MKKDSKTYQILTIALFGSLLLFLMLQFFFHFIPEKSVDGENRTLAECPTLEWSKLNAFPAQYDRYLNDNFPFRSHFLDVYFTYSIFNHQSPIPSVILGKDNFLFSSKEELDLYTGKLDFTEKQMDWVVDELVSRWEMLQQKGIRLYVVLAPTALEIYPEYLPQYIQRADVTVTETFCQKMAQQAPQIPFLYLKQTLLQHKDGPLMYCKNDNHWNPIGSEFGAEAIFAMMAKDFPQLPTSIQQDFVLTPFIRHSGNLGLWLSSGKYAKDFQDDQDYHVRYRNAEQFALTEDTIQDYEPTPGFPYPYEYEKQFVTNRMGPKLVTIRDSYCNALIPYLSPYFRESLFIFDAWQYGANWDIIQNEDPDIVLLIIYEPHIRNIFLSQQK